MEEMRHFRDILEIIGALILGYVLAFLISLTGTEPWSLYWWFYVVGACLIIVGVRRMINDRRYLGNKN